MCGRFLLTYDLDAIKARYQIPDDEHVIYSPSPEIFPSEKIPAIIRIEHSNHLEMMEWGFPNPTGKGLLINARGETAAVKPTFRKPFLQGRCLVPTNGFFEWKQENEGKVKYRIRHENDTMFSFAGLYQRLTDPDHGTRFVCVIITTEPTSGLSLIHNRMPAILSKENETLWLDPYQRDVGFLTSLLEPYDPDGIRLIVEHA